MPIYEYRCSACGFEKDALQRMSEAPLVECPECGKPSLVKLISAAGFQLKGSGWYATDFKGSGSKPPAKTDSGAKAEGSAGEAADSKSGKAPDAASGKSEAAAPATPATPAAGK